jgi:hypothetical protein
VTSGLAEPTKHPEVLGHSLLSLAGPVNLAAALRHHARDPARSLATLGITLG